MEDVENKLCFFLILSRSGHKFKRGRERGAMEELKPAFSREHAEQSKNTVQIPTLPHQRVYT